MRPRPSPHVRFSAAARMIKRRAGFLRRANFSRLSSSATIRARPLSIEQTFTCLESASRIESGCAWSPPEKLTRSESGDACQSSPDLLLLRLGPSRLVRRRHPADRAQMLELPLPVDLDVVVLVARRQPYRPVTLAERERPHEIPAALRLVAIDLDNRVHHVMLREADPLLETLEQLANRRKPLMLPDGADALPDSVLGKQRRNLRGVVIIVADGAITRLEFLDRLDILDNRDPLLQFGIIHDSSSSSDYSTI